MKKGRPAFTVHALCDESVIDVVRDVMVAETGTLGVRGATMRRWPATSAPPTSSPSTGTRSGWKRAAGRVKVEHDDAAAAAAALGLPLRVVMERAISIATGG
ncbi:MAG: nickel insertion protein [Ilumatobacteraceae bacterium]